MWSRKERRTPHLLEALLVLPGDCVILLLERLEAARQRIGDLWLVVLVLGARLVVVQGSLHLLDRLDQALCLLGHLVLLVGDGAQLAVECVGEGREELQGRLVTSIKATSKHRHVPLPRVSRAHGWALLSRRRDRAAGR